ncbi:FAD-dependent pyridine nucleotide-disulphide oxidoreductase [Thermoanaerobacterium thermosaccharolyticum DSM 571]|uniref:FAD-dependent pyridine nucleotide-disulphide oxidoreductase n=2 Tax=Thermoanaerobacterium thermosaccharolyticum TaxID=1517 RepID=D9TQ37_THETC|nr:CoA-disulfide reductase [Thermoanaerobacterium thermosaccharolyticum]ADL67824.1 FAD-dependent pyridine nucleotide-disulphide oxidoreductase [Thermoanaerobacterium thermosaccharolyticum DSM 571]
MKVVIVGGVAGGASAAARLRRLDENAEIILFEKGEYISYANCGLPYYIGEVIKEREKLIVQTPEAMSKRFNIDIRTLSEVTKIIPSEKTVIVHDIQNNKTYKETYDKLILSPGAEPIKPPMPGIDGKNIFTLRNIPDTYRIKDFVDYNKPKKAVVVGGGFIGLEVAENLKEVGLDVTVVELADHVMAPLDYEMASIVHQHLRDKGINLILKDGVKEFQHKNNSTTVVLNSGKTIDTDMVVLGIGVRPDIKLAKDAGLAIGDRGGIKVNEYLQTSDPDIYAVGDAIEVKDYINGSYTLIPLAGPANKQGRIAADNICGRNSKYDGTQGTSVAKIFDLTVAATGNNETILKRAGIDYEKVIIHPNSHASYYPDALPMTIKLIFKKEDGKILGAQIVGFDGVDKRIDVIATAIRANMTVYDLEELELSYAPPYSSAKDPVNMAGFAASNILRGDISVFHWDEIENIDMSKSIILDVRTDMEYELGNIKGSINIPVDELRENLDKIPKDKNIYVYCQVGLRGYIACRILMQNGFKSVKNLSGGYKIYETATSDSSDITIRYDDEQTECGMCISSDKKKLDDSIITLEIDACGLQCPGPIMQTFNAIKNLKDGDILKIKASDPGFENDIKTWCQRTGNTLLDLYHEGRTIVAKIKKNTNDKKVEVSQNSEKNDKAIIVFSGDLDKAIAAFIIANGAAAMGRKVTLFFTFWGLNILRKPEKVSIKKDFLSKMFGMMMPRGSKKLKLSKMNMLGIGPKMIRYIMNKKNVASLENLIKQALKNGVRIVACNMSSDIMGITKEELIDGVELGGVASFIGAAEQSDTTLFI